MIDQTSTFKNMQHPCYLDRNFPKEYNTNPTQESQIIKETKPTYFKQIQTDLAKSNS